MINGCAFLYIIDYLVHLIVGELDLLEADDLLGELVPGEGGVRVGVEAVRRGRVTLASHQPTGAVIGVPETRGVISRGASLDTNLYLLLSHGMMSSSTR